MCIEFNIVETKDQITCLKAWPYLLLMVIGLESSHSQYLLYLSIVVIPPLTLK